MQQTGERTDSEAADTGLSADDVAAIAHDLRNPLNAAMSSVQVARSSGDAEHFDRAERSLRRMDDLIDHLLALGRGTDTDNCDRVSLAGVAEEAWDTTATESASLVVSDDGMLLADPSALDALLSNLFENAVSHGGEDVTVRVGTVGDGFFVADDGPGIPAADRDRVFEFGHSSEPRGSGYGLAIVSRIADAHGWDVSLTESESGGARFEFV
ncbi:sensor histidine kinase [Halobacteriales archaeon Cl-PHB]